MSYQPYKNSQFANISSEYTKMIKLNKDSFDNDEEITDLYNQGFLFSRIGKGVMVSGRSFRIDLEKFQLSSENRRILRKTEKFRHEVQDLHSFSYDPIRVGKFCKDYFDQKFGKGKMSAQSIRRIFAESLFNIVFVFRDQKLSHFALRATRGREDSSQNVVGYSVCYKNSSILHYAHPFYDLKYYKDNLGIGMMTKALLYAKEKELRYIYLGCVHSKEAFYKTQFSGGEWWDGKRWKSDMNTLKSLL